jgi:hypothetical protein
MLCTHPHSADRGFELFINVKFNQSKATISLRDAQGARLRGPSMQRKGREETCQPTFGAPPQLTLCHLPSANNASAETGG